MLERFSRIVEVPQVRFYTAIDLLSGDEDQFGYRKAEGSYEKTADTEVDPSKTYYTESGGVYTAVASPTKSGLADYYELVGEGRDINFMVVEKSAVIKYDKHVASRVFSPDELEALDSYMLKYRKYGIVSVLENKLDGVYVSAGSIPACCPAARSWRISGPSSPWASFSAEARPACWMRARPGWTRAYLSWACRFWASATACS